jgi:hypothetical protein
MFNLKRHKVAVDLSTKIKPQDIPGRTLEEKVAYISQYLDRSIGEQFAAGKISEEQVYQLLTDKQMETEEQFAFLEQYRTNINNLRKLAGDLLRAEGETEPTEDVINRIIQKLLAKTDSVFIPQLVKLHRVTSRTPELVEPLLEYKKPEEIATIRNFISSEVLKRRIEVRDEFLTILKYGETFNPDFTLEELCFILQNNDKAIRENEDLVLSQQQRSEVKAQLNKLAQKVRMMNSNQRIWNRILALNADIPRREEWAELIPESLRIDWDLASILKFFNYPLSNIPEGRRGKGSKAARELDERYYFFYPETDDLNRPFESEDAKRQYALSKLRECIENGYEDEAIFDCLGLTIRKGKVKKGRPKKSELPEQEAFEEETSEPEEGDEADVVVEAVSTPQRTSDDSYGRRLRYYFYYIVKPIESSLAFGSKQRLSAFRDDLRAANCSATAELLGRVYEKQEDERYRDFDLKFLSQEEKNICEILRNDYKLDVIPFPVKIPCPVDNPTSTDRFEIDFLMPADVLMGFEEDDYIDPRTGAVETIMKPIIEHQIIFIGEYFGIRYTMPKRIEDKGKPWVRPDNSIPVYRYGKDDKLRTFYAVPGGNCRELEFYKLKTEWKIFTTDVIGDLLGTRTLSLDDQDLDYPRRLMNKLDAQRIIYKHPECGKFKGCLAYNEIMKFATKTPEIDKYVYDEIIEQHFNSLKNRSLKVIDCAIVNVKLTEAMFKAKMEFETREYGGFDRQTMFNHKQIMDDLKARDVRLRDQLKIKADQKSLDKVTESGDEIKSLSSSPLKAFKDYLDRIFSEGKISQKIGALMKLREQIDSGQITPSLFELKTMITSISPEMTGQLAGRGEGEE